MQKPSGIAAATGAYLIWGLLPVYWKALKTVPAYEILCHRMAWSMLLSVALLLIFSRRQALIAHLRERRVVLSGAASGALLGINWLIYIWAVNSGYIIEASLGYFINPLVTVGFGVFFMKERLRVGQYGALGLAVLGVAYLTFVYGRFPWIALTLAITFAIYGLLHKKTSVAPIEGLCLETMALFLPAALFLVLREVQGAGAFIHAGAVPTLLLVGTGLITTFPLLLFAFAAHNIPLSLLGILQYTAPTINLLLGILVYGEGFPRTRLIGFVLVWSALLVYLLEGAICRARQKRALLLARRCPLS